MSGKKEDLIYYVIRMINNEKWKPNQKIPSIRFFANRFKLSNSTVASALSRLVKLQILVNKPQTGYFVSDNKFGFYMSESKIGNVTKTKLIPLSEVKNFFKLDKQISKTKNLFKKEYYNKNQLFKIVVMAISSDLKSHFHLIEESLFKFLNYHNLLAVRIDQEIRSIKSNPQIDQLFKVTLNYLVYIETKVYDKNNFLLQHARTYVLPEAFELSINKIIF